MLVHPWDTALDAAEWQEWLAATDRFGVLAVNHRDPAQAPLLLPTHFTVAGDELLLHLARPNPVWAHLEGAAQVRLAVVGDYAYIPTQWRAKAGGLDGTGSRRATTRRCSSCAVPPLSTTRRARLPSWLRSWLTSSRRAATPSCRPTSRRTAGCCPASEAYACMCSGLRLSSSSMMRTRWSTGRVSVTALTLVTTCSTGALRRSSGAVWTASGLGGRTRTGHDRSVPVRVQCGSAPESGAGRVDPPSQLARGRGGVRRGCVLRGR